MTATSTASLPQEAGDIQATTTRVGPSSGEPAVKLDTLQGEHNETSGVVVMLTDPEQIADAIFLKTEKIVYCPIPKVTSPYP